MGNKQPEKPHNQAPQKPVQQPATYTTTQLEDIKNQSTQALEQQRSLSEHQMDLNRQLEEINREKTNLNLSQQRIAALSGTKYYKDNINFDEITEDLNGNLNDMNTLLEYSVNNHDMNEEEQKSYQEIYENNEYIIDWVNGNEIGNDIYMYIYNLFFVTPEILDFIESKNQAESIIHAKVGFLLKKIIDNIVYIFNHHVDHSNVDTNMYYFHVIEFCKHY